MKLKKKVVRLLVLISPLSHEQRSKYSLEIFIWCIWLFLTQRSLSPRLSTVLKPVTTVTTVLEAGQMSHQVTHKYFQLIPKSCVSPPCPPHGTEGPVSLPSQPRWTLISAYSPMPASVYQGGSSSQWPFITSLTQQLCLFLPGGKDPKDLCEGTYLFRSWLKISI